MTEKKIERKLSPLFTWRSRICSEDGPKDPNTRFVLLVLSLYMSEKGDSCFPSIERLARESALSKTAVKKHLKIAAEDKWIVRTLREQPQRPGWSYYSYHASFGEGGARGDPPDPQPTQNQAVKTKVGREATQAQRVGRLTTPGGSFDDHQVGRQVARNTSLNTSIRRQGKPAQQCASEKTPSDPSTEQWLEEPENTLNPAEKVARAHYLQQMQQGVTQSDNGDDDATRTA